MNGPDLPQFSQVVRLQDSPACHVGQMRMDYSGWFIHPGTALFWKRRLRLRDRSIWFLFPLIELSDFTPGDAQGAFPRQRQNYDSQSDFDFPVCCNHSSCWTVLRFTILKWCVITPNKWKQTYAAKASWWWLSFQKFTFSLCIVMVFPSGVVSQFSCVQWPKQRNNFSFTKKISC